MSNGDDQQQSQTDATTDQTGTAQTDQQQTQTTDQQQSTQTTDQQTDQTKNGEETDHVALTAEAIKLPEGVELNQEVMGKFVELANENKWDAATAQSLVDLQIEAMNAVSEQGNSLWNEMQDKWSEETRADPVIGGENLEPTLGNIAKLIDKFSVDEKGQPSEEQAEKLREVFDLTGAGNNPTVARFLHAIANQLVVEGQPHQGGPSGAEQSPASIIYNSGKG